MTLNNRIIRLVSVRNTIFIILVIYVLASWHQTELALHDRDVLLQRLEESQELLEVLQLQVDQQRKVLQELYTSPAGDSGLSLPAPQAPASSSSSSSSSGVVTAAILSPLSSPDSPLSSSGSSPDDVWSPSVGVPSEEGAAPPVMIQGVAFTLHHNSIQAMYLRYRWELQEVRRAVRAWCKQHSRPPHIGDMEAEVLYMRIRELKPQAVAELGLSQGASSLWILNALNQNNIERRQKLKEQNRVGFATKTESNKKESGNVLDDDDDNNRLFSTENRRLRGAKLYTFDTDDQAFQALLDTINSEISDCWIQIKGNLRSPLKKLEHFEYIHINMDQTVSYTSWFLNSYLKSLQQPVQVSFRNVFESTSDRSSAVRRSHGISPEGRVILIWLSKRQRSSVPARKTDAFAFTRSHLENEYIYIKLIRLNVGLDEDWIAWEHFDQNNPTVFAGLA